MPQKRSTEKCAAENKVTFVSDWLIDGSYFIVEQPVGHTALNGNLPHAETAVSENAACCQLWQYLCSHWGRVCVNLCPASQSTGAFLLQTASKLFHKWFSAAEAKHLAALVEKRSRIFTSTVSVSRSLHVETCGINTKKNNHKL